MSDAPAVRELVPRKGSFIFPRIVAALITFGLIGAALTAAFALAERMDLALAGPALFLLGSGFVYYAAAVAFRKERYEIHPSRLRCHKGGITSDQTTELEVKNITHVKLVLPWLRWKFFGVGDVLIESAGSGGSEVALRSIPNVEAVYEEIAQLMQGNGYSLQRGKLLHQEKPDLVGVIVECLGLAVTVVAATLWGLFSLVIEFKDEIGEEQIEQVSKSEWVWQLLWVLGPLVALGALIALLVHFLDMRRRTYRVFSDVVVYEEGFLTRHNAFIPFENIADANTKRNLLDQLLGLYDVQISCQGSGSEIKFRRLRRGPELSEAIDALVASARERPKPAGVGEPESEEGPSLDLGLPQRKEPELVAPEDAWTADLKMHAPRVIVPLLLWLPLFPVWLMGMINAVIQLGATRFSVKASSVRHSFQFLQTNEREFAYDKITGLVIMENPWDRLFGTITVRLWSIGSGQPIDLAHVKKHQLNLTALLRQVGIPAPSPQPYEVETRFGLGAWVKAKLPGVIVLALIVLGLLVGAALVEARLAPVFLIAIAVLGLLTAGRLAYSFAYYKRQRLSFHEHHVEADQGVLWRKRFHARYSNVKKVQTVRYPASELGAVQIFVAGEHRIAQQKKGLQSGQPGQQAGATMPYSFTSGFLTGLEEKERLIDDILSGRVEAGPGLRPAEPLGLLCEESTRAVGNTLFKLILFSLACFPLAPLLPLTIPFAVVSIRRWRYRVEAGRVVVTWGILFRSQASVLFDRIDTLRKGQGLTNKIFGNGNVTLMTAGSSQPDLVLANVPDSEALYGEIQKRYGKK